MNIKKKMKKVKRRKHVSEDSNSGLTERERERIFKENTKTTKEATQKEEETRV